MKQIKNHSFLIALGLLLLSLNACRDISTNPIYQKPHWLDGKLYTQIEAEADLETFTELLQGTEWESILDRSGFFTVFAPTDSAFEVFFQKHPDYSSIADFDSLTRDNIIRYHIIEDGWSQDQLRRLTWNGFIDENSRIFNEPKAFKRQTLYRTQPKTIYVVPDKEQERILRTPSGGTSVRKVIPDTKKYAPVFYKEYFDIYEYNAQEDYTFYFDRDYDESKIYYANALLKEQTFAENGYVHKIDAVVLPLPSMEEALMTSYNGNEYTDFLDLIYEYPIIVENSAETKKQPGYDEGKTVDILYNVYYPYFAVDVDNEETGRKGGSSNSSLYIHSTMVAPSNKAYKKLMDGTITRKSGYPHYSSVNEVPDEVKWIIVNSAFSRQITYKTELDEGFKNEANDSIQLTDEMIVDKQFCSNGVFLGVDEPLIPRAFTSVAGPIWLRPGYTVFREAMLVARLMDEIKRADQEYTFFAVNDANLAQDSSMILEEISSGFFTRTSIVGHDRSYDPPTKFTWTSRQITNQMLNQICLGRAEGIAKYEYLPTLSGDFVKFNNVEHIVEGSGGSVFGFNGDSGIVLIPEPFLEPTDNGVAFEVNGWFSFGASASLFSKVREIGRVGTETENYFMKLCRRVGFADLNGFSSSFITSNDNYTVFVPGDKALRDYEDLENIRLDEMDIEELKQFLRYHFVRGDMIFTDGKKPSGDYQTLRVDEASSDTYKLYSKLKLNIDYDLIQGIDNEGTVVFDIDPEVRNSNLITYSRILDPNDPTIVSILATGIVHEIRNVLVYSK